MRTTRHILLLNLLGALAAGASLAAAPATQPATTGGTGEVRAGEQETTCRITGLFSPEREADLRTAIEKVPGVSLLRLDFDHAEATIGYEKAKGFADTKPDKIVERFDQLLKPASHYTFGVKPVSTTPRDKLTRVEFPIMGLDCKACCLYVYELLAREEGVEQATASFKEGRATALIDPEKTSREKLEAVLTKHEVPLKKP